MPSKYDGMLVREILLLKKASVRHAPLPAGSPAWSDIDQLQWEEIDALARQNQPGYRTIRKLLSDGRFDR